MASATISSHLLAHGKRHFHEELKRWDPKDASLAFVRGRRFIPHGHCERDDTYWKPHPTAIDPQYTDCGPDWKSSLRFIPSPHDMHRRSEELWPESSTKLRTFPGSTSSTVQEWMFYTNGFETGKRCLFEKMHKRSGHGLDEVTHVSSMGYKRKENNIDKRNGIYSASRGDNHYQAVEYSPDFFKKGATLAPTNFSEHYVKENDTFIPLTPLPPIPPIPYKDKESQRKYDESIEDVLDLDRWRPATPIQLTLKSNMFTGPKKR